MIDVLKYDPETGTMTWRKPPKNHAEKAGMEAGGPVANGNNKSYWVIGLNGKKYKRSRLAFLMMTGKRPADQVDHINGNSLDDRWCNLREATPAENARNHKSRAKKSDLPMGVRIAASGRFVARIGHEGDLITIGTFNTVEDATEAYIKKRQELFGEFA